MGKDLIRFHNKPVRSVINSICFEANMLSHVIHPMGNPKAKSDWPVGVTVM